LLETTPNPKFEPDIISSSVNPSIKTKKQKDDDDSDDNDDSKPSSKKKGEV
jgi:hypothetical protein